MSEESARRLTDFYGRWTISTGSHSAQAGHQIQQFFSRLATHLIELPVSQRSKRAGGASLKKRGHADLDRPT